MLGLRQFAVPQFDVFSSGSNLSCEHLSGIPNLLALQIFPFLKTLHSKFTGITNLSLFKNLLFSPIALICGWCVCVCVCAHVLCVCACMCVCVCVHVVCAEF